jgi:hypothetical protein
MCQSVSESFIPGRWIESIDIGCDGEVDETNELIFHEDHTFESNPRCHGYEGTWSYSGEGNTIQLTFNGCDYPEYKGLAGLSFSGLTGNQGLMQGTIEGQNICWSANRPIE